MDLNRSKLIVYVNRIDGGKSKRGKMKKKGNLKGNQKKLKVKNLKDV